MRHLDTCIIKEINRLKRRRHADAMCILKLKRALRLVDEGKKGMKRGQHVMARNPEYLAALKGGNGNRFGNSRRATFMGAVKGQEKALSKSYDNLINKHLVSGDYERFERLSNRPMYNKISAANRLMNNQRHRLKVRNEARKASELSRAAGNGIVSAKTRIGSGIKVRTPEGVKVKRFLPKRAKMALAGVGALGGLAGAGLFI